MRRAAFSDLGQTQITGALTEAGALIAEQVRSNASFSTRIPSQVRFGARRSSVRISVTSGRKPHKGEARALEHGGRPGMVRHPVFGNKDVWRESPAHPFLAPAVEARKAEVMRAVDKTVTRALRRIR